MLNGLEMSHFVLRTNVERLRWKASTWKWNDLAFETNRFDIENEWFLLRTEHFKRNDQFGFDFKICIFDTFGAVYQDIHVFMNNIESLPK
jgi:hypothetical protein